MCFLFTAPPQKVEISSHPNEAKIKVNVDVPLRLDCAVRYAKPAATIVWYRGNVQIKGGDTSVTPISIEDGEYLQLSMYLHIYGTFDAN